MKIIVQQNSDTAKVEIDTKNCNYQWSFRDALILAMTIEGFQKSFIDAVFNQEEINLRCEPMNDDDCSVPSENN
jgi:hypothetical protein